MPQIAPFLETKGSRPLLPSRGGGGDEGPGGGGDGLPARLPIAGFWRRVGALLFDFVFLFVVARLAGAIAREPLLALDEWARMGATFLAFLYFALGNGPVGGGRTIGKFLVGIKVTNLDGGVPTFGQGIARTLVLFPAFIPALLVQPFVQEHRSPAMTSLLFLTQGYLELAIIVGCVFAVLFNPFKQGFHDFAARTLVRPAQAPQLTFDELTAIIDGAWRRLQVQAQINGAIPAVVVYGLLLVFLWPPSLLGGPLGQRLQLQIELMERLGIAEGRMENATLLPDMTDEERVANPARALEDFVDDITDPASSRQIKLQIIVSREGKWSLQGEELQHALGELARQYRPEIHGKLPPEAIFPRLEKPPTNLNARPMRVEVIALEYLRLFLFPVFERELARVEVLVDPLEEFVPPPPGPEASAEEPAPPAEPPAPAGEVLAPTQSPAPLDAAP